MNHDIPTHTYHNTKQVYYRYWKNIDVHRYVCACLQGTNR